ncbi:methyl-CpG-binding domain protein 2-like [Panicum virgatum]|uniref:methyl-CpG-binding domain protein 2-like n=1 Tax=Panicum virgatum TaxID=38727 RepID=UPI0019D56F77|nr:methyl-CpG-binding domain protein 2-like [Panicum virgatum]
MAGVPAAESGRGGGFPGSWEGQGRWESRRSGAAGAAGSPAAGSGRGGVPGGREWQGRRVPGGRERQGRRVPRRRERHGRSGPRRPEAAGAAVSPAAKRQGLWCSGGGAMANQWASAWLAGGGARGG